LLALFFGSHLVALGAEGIIIVEVNALKVPLCQLVLTLGALSFISRECTKLRNFLSLAHVIGPKEGSRHHICMILVVQGERVRCVHWLEGQSGLRVVVKALDFVGVMVIRRLRWIQGTSLQSLLIK